jgi:hypothetical protein
VKLVARKSGAVEHVFQLLFKPYLVAQSVLSVWLVTVRPSHGRSYRRASDRVKILCATTSLQR